MGTQVIRTTLIRIIQLLVVLDILLCPKLVVSIFRTIGLMLWFWIISFAWVRVLRTEHGYIWQLLLLLVFLLKLILRRLPRTRESIIVYLFRSYLRSSSSDLGCFLCTLLLVLLLRSLFKSILRDFLVLNLIFYYLYRWNLFRYIQTWITCSGCFICWRCFGIIVKSMNTFFLICPDLTS